jgi:hypothetical protein
MYVYGPVLVTVNSLASAALLVAGATKLAVPQPVRRAVRELSGDIPVSAVRAFAVAEMLVAFGLVLPAMRVFAGMGLGVLGAVFVASGVAGRVRRSAVPCGCLGSGQHALGLRNVVAGALFLGAAGLNTVAGSTGGDPWTAAPLIAAVLTLLLCLWINRALMWRLLRPRPVPAAK